jgi:hypothetical protein
VHMASVPSAMTSDCGVVGSLSLSDITTFNREAFESEALARSPYPEARAPRERRQLMLCGNNCDGYA